MPNPACSGLATLAADATVRRGCAAQSSALTGHCLQQSSREPTRPRLNVAGSQRCPLTSRAPFVVRQAPRRSRVFRRRIHPHPTPSTARPLRLAVPRAVADRASRSRRRVGSPRLRHNPRMRTASKHTERLAMPSFAPRAISGSAPPCRRTCEAASGLSLVLRWPRASSTRPASIRPRLTRRAVDSHSFAVLATDAHG